MPLILNIWIIERHLGECFLFLCCPALESVLKLETRVEYELIWLIKHKLKSQSPAGQSSDWDDRRGQYFLSDKTYNSSESKKHVPVLLWEKFNGLAEIQHISLYEVLPWHCSKLLQPLENRGIFKLVDLREITRSSLSSLWYKTKRRNGSNAKRNWSLVSGCFRQENCKIIFAQIQTK